MSEFNCQFGKYLLSRSNDYCESTLINLYKIYLDYESSIDLICEFDNTNIDIESDCIKLISANYIHRFYQNKIIHSKL